MVATNDFYKLALLLVAASSPIGRHQNTAVDPASGYTITATADSPMVDAAWLTSFASAVAYRWKVP